jgi:hypothetical protein
MFNFTISLSAVYTVRVQFYPCSFEYIVSYLLFLIILFSFEHADF